MHSYCCLLCLNTFYSYGQMSAVVMVEGVEVESGICKDCASIWVSIKEFLGKQ